jgi:hypothetical protein
LDIDGTAAEDYTGRSDSTILAVGADGNDAGGLNAGRVRVFRYDTSVPTSWSLFGIQIVGAAAGDLFGARVALSSSGNVLAGGAPGNDGAGSNAGHIRVFAYDTGVSNWVQRGADLQGELRNDMFGSAVAISADGAVVAGGSIQNGGGGFFAWHVRVWEYSTASAEWVRRGDDLDGLAGHFFGRSVALSADGSALAAGGGSVSNNGFTRVYDFSPGAGWSLRGAQIDGQAASDFSKSGGRWQCRTMATS